MLCDCWLKSAADHNGHAERASGQAHADRARHRRATAGGTRPRQPLFLRFTRARRSRAARARRIRAELWVGPPAISFCELAAASEVGGRLRQHPIAKRTDMAPK